MSRHASPPRPLLTALLAVAGTAGVTVGAPTATAEPITFPELIDEEELCVELTPHVASYETVPVRLDLRILLDRGAPKAIAQRAAAQMKQAYEPLGITVKPSYQKVRLKGGSAPGLNEQAKRFFGGERPQGIDVVYTLTTADIGAGPPHYKNVAGLADCIGGVRFDDRAFAVGEIFPEETTGSTLPLPSSAARASPCPTRSVT